MARLTHISERLIIKLTVLPSVKGIVEDIKKKGTKVPDGYDIPADVWEDLRRDYKLAPSRGFGDTFAKVAKAFGVKSCGGCDKRRAKLNKLIRYE